MTDYFWQDASWADIEFHIDPYNGDFLLIKSFAPDRSRKYVRNNRRSHDAELTVPLTQVMHDMYKGRSDITVLIREDQPAVLSVTGRFKLTDWRDRPANWDRSQDPASFVMSTYLNQCDYYANGHVNEKPDPHAELAETDPYSTAGLLAGWFAQNPDLG